MFKQVNVTNLFINAVTNNANYLATTNNKEGERNV